MVVLIKKYPDKNTIIDDRIDCDKAHQISNKNDIHLVLYKDSKIIHDELFTEKVNIYFMEHGKTIDRVSFKVNEQ